MAGSFNKEGAMFEEQEVRGPVGNWDVWLAGSAIRCLASRAPDEDRLRTCAVVIREVEFVRRIYTRDKCTGVTGIGPLLSPVAYRHLMLFREAGLAAGFQDTDDIVDVVGRTLDDVFRTVQTEQSPEDEKKKLALKFFAEVSHRTLSRGTPMCAVPLHSTPYYDDSD